MIVLTIASWQCQCNCAIVRRLAMAIPCSQWWYLHMTSVDFIAIFQRKFMIICVRVGGGNNGTPFISCSFHTISIAQFTGPVAIIMTATFLSHPIRAIALVNRFYYYLNTNKHDKNAFSYSFKRFEHVKMTTANLERCFVVIFLFSVALFVNRLSCKNVTVDWTLQSNFRLPMPN